MQGLAAKGKTASRFCFIKKPRAPKTQLTIFCFLTPQFWLASRRRAWRHAANLLPRFLCPRKPSVKQFFFLLPSRNWDGISFFARRSFLENDVLCLDPHFCWVFFFLIWLWFCATARPNRLSGFRVVASQHPFKFWFWFLVTWGGTTNMLVQFTTSLDCHTEFYSLSLNTNSKKELSCKP